MNYIHLANIFNSFIKARLFKHRCPLVVSWALTYKCNGSCLYCHLGNHNLEELETKQIISIVDQLYKAGTKFIIFTGGEPLTRADIGIIIQYTANRGIKAIINTNGKLVLKKINELKKASLLKISLDGPIGINDSIRGAGSFEKAIEAIGIAKQSGIKAEINAVISRINVSQISGILKIAETNQVPVFFQPASILLLGENQNNPISPAVEDYRQAITFLIKQKLGKNKVILNSLSSLQHLFYWPTGRRINCFAGLLSCRIEPGGKLFACGWVPVLDQAYGLDLKKVAFRDAFRMLKRVSCEGCWSSACIDFNLLASFSPATIRGLLKNYSKYL